MLDPRLIRNELDDVAQRLARRGYELDREAIAALEAQRKDLQVRTQDLQNERNTKSKGIGKAKAAGEDTAPLLAAVADLGDRLKAAETELAEVQGRLEDILMGVPNLPHESVPDGRDENDNVEVRRWGEPPRFDFGARSR